MPARPKQSRVQDVRPIGAGQHDDALRRGKAVHLHQQLVQRVLALVITSRKAAAPTRPPDGINLICTSSSVKPLTAAAPRLTNDRSMSPRH